MGVRDSQGCAQVTGSTAEVLLDPAMRVLAERMEVAVPRGGLASRVLIRQRPASVAAH